MIAITFALPAESADFVQLIENPMLNSREGVESIRGQIHGQAVAVMHTGVGERSCRAEIEPFLRRQKFEYLISAGFAGAIEKELQVGHLLLAENFSSPELLQSPQLDLGGEGLFLGKLVTVPEIVNSISERNRLASKSGAAAVDMETEFIAAACAEQGLPMLSLRAISDTRSAPFPAPPEVLFDVARQRTDFVRLAFHLLSHPAAFGRLNAFRQQIAVARGSLTTTLDKILQSRLI